MGDLVYRICTQADWAEAQAQGQLPPSDLDRRDGYVHLSTAAQVPGTLARFFVGRDDLVLLTLTSDALVGELRFEAPAHDSSGDAGGASQQLFPHLYGEVPQAAVVAADPLALDPAGHHQLPDALASLE